MLSREGIGIVGRNVTIEAAEDASSVTETQKFRQSGINVSLKGGAVDTAMAVKSSVDRTGQVKDERLAALHLAQAGQTLFSGGQAGMNSLQGAGDQFGALANTNTDTQATGNNGLSLRIGIGASKSSSSVEYNATTAAGSRIASEGDVVIHATGDGKGNGGDLTVTGSQIEGDNVTLAAARDLLLQAQQETREQVERNKASSGEIGVTIGSEAGIGVYVSASAAKGKGDGNGTTHAETTVDAANTLTLVSGRDTTLEGAQARGETVIADIGRNLTMTSQQDTNDYRRKDQSAGIDAAIGTGGGQVSASYNQSKIDSSYTSVKEQTGIQAGEGGFDIRVGGHTQLNGAAIASAADPSRNRLETGSLGWSDLENEAEYKASSFGISASGGSGGGSVSPNISVPQHEKSGSTTQAGIADGTLIVHDGSGEGIARDVTELQQDGLKEIFDQQKVAERMEMGQVAGQVGMRAAGDLAQKMGWEEGSKEKVILHGAVGAAMAALGGGSVLEGLTGAVANQMAFNAMRDYLTETAALKEGSEAFNVLLQLGSMAVGAAAGGGTGSAVALSATQNNYLTHQQIEKLQSELGECRFDEQCLNGVVEKYIVISGLNNDELVSACRSAPSGDACQGGIREAMNYAGDQSWKSYGSMPLGVDRERVGQKINQLDGDIGISRDVALGLMFGDKTVYGAINDIESRADFFGAMYQQTGAVWFKAAENQSRTNLSGFRFNLGVLYNRVLGGGDVMAQWRSAAGDQIMANGFENFNHIYNNPFIDLNGWSVLQLINEQSDPVLQEIHGLYIPRMVRWSDAAIEVFGGVDDIMDVRERIKTGCRNMGMDASCGDEGK